MVRIEKIISGGQTGVDRAALNFALAHDIPCGGFCPKGRKCEDGIIDEKYPLIETQTSDYSERTRLNLLNADGTLLLTLNNQLGPGAKLTFDWCIKFRKPVLLLELSKDSEANGFRLTQWKLSYNVKTLNIAGNRESQTPGIYSATLQFLEEMIFVKPSAYR
ncbi:molybdenum cofactor carrier [Marinilabiliaceae bacterium JC017]|nr:molybdenum cofactor carrier [Marinilabiliaceae bacterium JC017]